MNNPGADDGHDMTGSTNAELAIDEMVDGEVLVILQKCMNRRLGIVAVSPWAVREGIGWHVFDYGVEYDEVAVLADEW